MKTATRRLFYALAALAVFLGFQPPRAEGAQKTLDPATVSRLQAFVNQKRMVAREIVGTNVVYTFAQAGRTWSETNAVRHVDGMIQPTRYSKLKIYAALARAGKWNALKSWLETQTVDGVNAYDAFMLAQNLTSDHPLFMQYFTTAKQVLDIDDATADWILAQAEEW